MKTTEKKIAKKRTKKEKSQIVEAVKNAASVITEIAGIALPIIQTFTRFRK